jgi:uncharacterized protein (TIGR03435 family)
MLSRYLPRPEASSATVSSPADDLGPTIFEAVQQQLGLKLEARRAAVEFVVVDRVEKVPTGN